MYWNTYKVNCFELEKFWIVQPNPKKDSGHILSASLYRPISFFVTLWHLENSTHWGDYVKFLESTWWFKRELLVFLQIVISKWALQAKKEINLEYVSLLHSVHVCVFFVNMCLFEELATSICFDICSWIISYFFLKYILELAWSGT